MTRCSFGFFVVSLCGFLLYKCAGTFFGTFRTDELYFLQDAWSAYMGFSESRGLPPLFNKLIERYWGLVGGDVDGLWMLRLWIFPVVIVQAWVIYAMASATVPSKIWGRSLIRALLAVVFVAVMCAYRAYEVRPELIPNTLVLWSAYAIFFAAPRTVGHSDDWLKVVLAGLGLVVAASMSFRYTMVALLLLLAFTVGLVRRGVWRQAFPMGVILTSWVGCALYLNLFLFNILASIQRAAEAQSLRESLPLIDRLTVGGGGVHFYSKVTILLCIIGLLAKRHSDSKSQEGKGATVAVLLALAAYYAFLFTVDVRPFEYVRSIEWVLISIGLFLTFKGLDWRSRSRHCYVGAALAASLSVAAICVEAVENLDQRRSTALALEGLLAVKSRAELASAPDSNVVTWVLSTGSVVNQVRARAEYCRRHRNGLVMVNTFNYHPICLRDAGSLRLSGWEGSIGFEEIEFGELQWFSIDAAQQKMLGERVAGFGRVGDVFFRLRAP